MAKLAGGRRAVAQVLGDSRQRERELGSARPAQPETTKPEDTLQMGEQHLDVFAVSAGLLEGLGPGERTGDVARILMDAARDLARRLLWTAPVNYGSRPTATDFYNKIGTK